MIGNRVLEKEKVEEIVFQSISPKEESKINNELQKGPLEPINERIRTSWTNQWQDNRKKMNHCTDKTILI